MQDTSEYDFIVVGAGSAGSVLATRLSEDPAAHVLALEAGGTDIPDNVLNPSVWYTLFGSAVDWGYQSVPQLGLGGRQTYEPRGKLAASDQVVFIRCGDAYLELFQATGDTPAPAPGGAGPEYPAWRHLAFRVDDVDAKLDEMGTDARVTGLLIPKATLLRSARATPTRRVRRPRRADAARHRERRLVHTMRTRRRGGCSRKPRQRVLRGHLDGPRLCASSPAAGQAHGLSRETAVPGPP